jgi:hypothetical protein
MTCLFKRLPGRRHLWIAPGWHGATPVLAASTGQHCPPRPLYPQGPACQTGGMSEPKRKRTPNGVLGRTDLDQAHHASSTIDLRLAAVRHIAYEVADAALISPVQP